MKLNGENEGTETARDFLSRRAGLLCALLLALMAAQMLSFVARKSMTVDEWVMIPAGYYHLTTGDYQPVNEHPPFAKTIAAVPLLLTDTQAPPIDPAGHGYDYFNGLFQNFWRENAARFDDLSFRARVPAILVTVLLGALVFVFTRKHWGPRAALFAVALFSLEPTVLAHGRVVQTDIPSALAFLVAVRFTGARRRGLTRKQVAGHAAALAVAAVVAVNAAYLFHHRQPESLDEAMSRMIVPMSNVGSLRDIASSRDSG